MVKSPLVHPSSSMENESSTYSKQQEMNRDSASARSSDSSGEVNVCCGCRPKAKRRSRKFRKLGAKLEAEPSSGKKLWKKAVSAIKKARNRRYQDADIGDDSEWTAFSQNRDARSIKSGEGSCDDELYFFDAVDRPLGDEEYPIDGYAIGTQKFKVVFTTSIHSSSTKASLSDPDSMLRRRSRSSSLGSMSSLNDEFEDACEFESIESSHSRKTKVSSHNRKTKIQNHSETSARFERIRTSPYAELEVELTKPMSSTIEDAIGLAGYPGTLTVEQLEECVSKSKSKKSL